MSLCFATSFNQRLFENDSQKVVESVRRIYPEAPLYIGHENSYEKQFGRGVESIEGALQFDVFEENPYALGFIEDSPMGDWKNIQDYWNRNAVFWFRKLLALQYVMREATEDIVVWLDCDIELGRPFDANFINWINEIPCATILRKGQSIDSSVIVFNRKAGGSAIFARWLNIYLTGRAFAYRRWDDGFILTAVAQNTVIRGLTPEYGCPVSIFDYHSHAKSAFVNLRDKE